MGFIGTTKEAAEKGPFDGLRLRNGSQGLKPNSL
jgi:hypothetical protein